MQSPNEQSSPGDGSASSPPSKKLRFTDHDLKIILKFKDAAGEDTEKAYDVYSQVYAKHSKFIDTALSVDMQEKERKEIVFKDVLPKLFDKAMNYLDDPLSVRYMETKDALRIVEFYDEYEFTEGIKICDGVLAESARNYRKSSACEPVAVDEMVKICVVAESFHLERCSKQCLKFLKTSLCTSTRPFLSQNHVKQLHQMLLRHEPDLLMERLGLSKEELESPLFPRIFVDAAAARFAERTLSSVSVVGTGMHQLDGNYYLAGDKFLFVTPRIFGLPQPAWDGQSANFYIGKSDLCDKDWALVANFADGRESDNEEACDNPELYLHRVLWKCPNSSTLLFPPPTGWIAVHRTTKDGQVPVPQIKTCTHRLPVPTAVTNS